MIQETSIYTIDTDNATSASSSNELKTSNEATIEMEKMAAEIWRLRMRVGQVRLGLQNLRPIREVNEEE